MKSSHLRFLLLFCALYDGVLGLSFLFAAPQLFDLFGVPPVNHFGYVHFPAALLLIFALGFFRASGDPRRHRDLVLAGLLLKLAYVGVAGFHWATGGVPFVWKPFVVIDAVTAVGLFLGWRSTRR